MSRPIDAAARERALDCGTSFIVQAPAGSGKTGLLIQRVLALLAVVDKPEEVLAITFTRKAAAEMRGRILEALAAAGDPAPAEDYQRTTWQLARRVVERDEALEWGLAVNPSRLQLMTIDSLALSLVRQMPMLSRFGASPAIATRPEPLYRQAARRVLATLENDDAAALSLRTVLEHLDNDARKTESLLVRMLATRDHWLPHVAGEDRPELSRANLEALLADCVRRALKRACEAVPDALSGELVELAAYAGGGSDPSSPLAACAVLDALPDAGEGRLRDWLGIRHLLLTASGTVRSRLTAREGFPAPSSTRDADAKARRAQWKQRGAALLQTVAQLPQLRGALADLDLLPPSRYRNEDWQMLEALRRLLPFAAAELKVVFQEAGSVDFTEVNHRALMALGSDDVPTDLALQLDYRIRHLLVDEFQDTSRTHFELIERLVSGWQRGDGRTLFLVGDPMQSIYRFREADVGLFLHARQHGVGHVALEFLRLQSNFRSRPAVVEFCNRTFARLFPERESIEDSAVAFADSHAARPDDERAGVTLHAVPGDAPDGEAELVAQIVRGEHADAPASSIAVLVRSRAHLAAVLPALRGAGLACRAVEIERLADRPVVSDLWALTRALLHLGDRAAWLAVLRAPWCGLTLDELHRLVGANGELTVWELMVSAARKSPLGAEGARRLARVKGVLANSLADRGRRDLRRWIEGAWLALGGPACANSDADLADATAYFDLLESFDVGGNAHETEELASAIGELFAAPDGDADETLQVMTIHKAKGLEFDAVVVAGLHRGTAGDQRPLLMWLESTRDDGRGEVLLAPIHETGEEDPIGRYVNAIKRRRDEFEELRLLYVAATRARERLHLVTGVSLAGDGAPRAPAARSLAARLWPVLAEGFAARAQAPAGSLEVRRGVRAAPELRRLVADWGPPAPPAQTLWRGVDTVLPDAEERAPDWAGDAARHVGTAVHRVLQQVAIEGLDRWIGRWIDGLDEYLARMLTMLGVDDAELEYAARRAETAVRRTLEDERGRWILAPHRAARAELPLSAWLDGRLYNVVLDRSFIDDDGTRWIIDYKTGEQDAAGLDVFLDEQYQRYRGQLEFYARVMRRYDRTPIRLGLYFPMNQGWRAWVPG